MLSSSDATLTRWTIAFAFAPVLWLAYCLVTARRPNFPPGPKGWPFIGNVLQMGENHLELLFREWARQFGEIVYIQILNQPMVILTDLEAARDLLDKRSSIYSDRPRFVLFSDLMGWHSASTHIRYGPRFRKHRRFIQQTFNQRASIVFHPLQERESLILLDNMIQSPDFFVRHFKRFAAATIFPITYGHNITSADDVFIKLADKAATLTVRSGTPAASLVDFIPALRHIPTWAPFAEFKRKALETRVAVEEMMNIPFEMVKKQMRSGQAQPCFTSTLLEMHCDPRKVGSNSEDERDIRGAAGTLYAAAEDTTVAVMQAFMLAMVRHPEVLFKAQEEMDRVIGVDRLPTYNDRGSLPYLDCVLKEVLRWNPPVPLGMPHRVMEDNSYLGYYIPKGTIVLVNIFAILHDCPHPEDFQPERYLKGTDYPDPRELVFGFGRRICPGRHFAESSIWIMMANIIAMLDVGRTSEDKEKGKFPELDFTCGLVRHPKPFKCSVRPRRRNTTTLIQEARHSAEF
ncbi:O-methylsterigmatocystin oxidoreductase [Termitomyces sp. T112]|nr:O-methylsterigmatocystin oxidoreductase [Termitomyces sp. T112]